MDILIKALKSRVESGQMTINDVPAVYVENGEIVEPITEPPAPITQPPTLEERIDACEYMLIDMLNFM